MTRFASGELTPATLGVSSTVLCRYVFTTADGRETVFLRCATGELPGLWVMRSDGTGQRLISRGIDGTGADHPRWLPRQQA